MQEKVQKNLAQHSAEDDVGQRSRVGFWGGLTEKHSFSARRGIDRKKSRPHEAAHKPNGVGLMDDDAEADAEVTLEFAVAVFSFFKVSRIVVELNEADVDAFVDLNVDPAAERQGEISLAFRDIVIVEDERHAAAGELDLLSGNACQSMEERLDARAVLGVVLYLYAAEVIRKTVFLFYS